MNKKIREKYEYREHLSTYEKTNQFYEFIGIHEFKYVDQTESFGSKEVSRYYIYLSAISDGYKQVYQLIGYNSFQDCSSSYVLSSYGWLSEITPFNKPLPPLHYTLKNGVNSLVRLIERKPDFEDYEETFDYNPNPLDVYRLQNTDDIVIMSCSHSGSDTFGYYPEGYCLINSSIDVLVPSCRTKKKRPIYIFKGESGIGKSFIASHLDLLDTYETDLSQHIPDNISDYHVIVVGNKYPNQYTEIQSLLKKHDIEIVNVDFTYHK
jgi:hypothetical protein